jgi:hypothetical protein
LYSRIPFDIQEMDGILFLKRMKNNQDGMVGPAGQSSAVAFGRRAAKFAPFVAIILFVASLLGSADLYAATYVRINVGGRPYYGYPYRYRGYYHYRGGIYRHRYYRYGYWHYY